MTTLSCQPIRAPPALDQYNLCHPVIVRYSLMHGSPQVTAADFRRIALSLEGVEEYPHAGCPLFASAVGSLLRWPRRQGGTEI